MRAGWPLCFFVTIALAGCGPQAPVPAAQPAAPERTGSVRISGGDELAQVLSWSLPQVQLQASDAVQARARARRALAAGDLFESADSAIPLLLALQRLQPDDGGIAQALDAAREALVAQGDAALEAGDEDLDGLRAAQRRGAVLRRLWPQEAVVVAYLQRVDRSERAWDRNAEARHCWPAAAWAKVAAAHLALIHISQPTRQ
ncbi:MAG: hypothetical protein KBD58_07940, partial [Thermomonas sp.]|nr:hypothetical protein [Thermomonas sp.]